MMVNNINIWQSRMKQPFGIKICHFIYKLLSKNMFKLTACVCMFQFSSLWPLLVLHFFLAHLYFSIFSVTSILADLIYILFGDQTFFFLLWRPIGCLGLLICLYFGVYVFLAFYPFPFSILCISFIFRLPKSFDTWFK